MSKILLGVAVALLGLLLAPPALAGAGSFVRCGETRAADYSLGVGERACYEMTDANYDSMAHAVIVAREAKICLIPDSTDVEGPANLTINVRYCPTAAAPDIYSCIKVNTAVIDGTHGDEDTQNACVHVSTGRHWVQVVDAAGAGDTPVVTFQGF